MHPGLRNALIRALTDDAKVRKGERKHTEYVFVHLTPEQAAYLRTKKVDARQGLGAYIRRLLIIDMERQQWREEQREERREEQHGRPDDDDRAG